jgi:hypothetical protein
MTPRRPAPGSITSPPVSKRSYFIASSPGSPVAPDGHSPERSWQPLKIQGDGG